MPQPKAPEGALLGHREGSRWINRRPTGEEVAAWFQENVSMHEGLDPANYVGGIVLIGGKETLKAAKVASGGSVQFVDEERYAWTPYAKVETRVKYFWDLMGKREGLVGAIEPVDMTRLADSGVYNLNLPPGFFRTPVQLRDGKFVHYVCCAMRVVVYKADSVEWRPRGHHALGENPTDRELQVAQWLGEEVLRGIPVAIYPPATKMISTLGKHTEDPFALMKAETGAIGRALGMAGMLVIPGSGIATAEDMAEAQAGATGIGLGDEAALPTEAPLPPGTAEVDIRDQINEAMSGLKSGNPDGYQQLEAWAAERKIDLEAPKETQLRGLLLQVQRIAG